MLRLPAAVLTYSNRLMAANKLFEQLMPIQVQDRRKRVTLTDRRADALLEQALPRLSSTSAFGQVQSIPIAAAGEHPPSIAHIVPLRRAARRPLCCIVLYSGHNAGFTARHTCG